MRAATIGITLFLAAAVYAQDKQLTPEQAADKVHAAFKAKEAETLKALAGKDNPDPWLVADELCFRGKHDAAEAFAKAAPRKDTEKLPTYVKSRRGKTPNVAAREALAALNKAFAARDAQAALAATEAVDANAADVDSVRCLHARGAAFRHLRRLQASATVFLVAAKAGERLGWLALAASGFRESGLSAYYRSDWSSALAAWERRLTIEESRANRAGVAATLVSIGNIHISRGDYAKALGYYERALETMDVGDRAGVATTLGNIGEIHYRRGDYAKALGYQERALKMKQELKDRAGVAMTLGNIGNIHISLGDYAKALGYQERALKLKAELGNRAEVAATLANIGIIHERLGSYTKALGYQERALKIRDGLGDRRGVAGSLGNIGAIHERLGSYAKALRYQERALKLNEALGDRAGVARALGDIGNIHAGLGDYAKALAYQERALKLKVGMGKRADVAGILGNIGITHERLGSYAKALRYQERALKLKEELGDRAGVAATLGNIGIIHYHRGDYAKALGCQERALKLEEELGNRAGMAATLGNIGIIHERLGSYGKALDYQERALKIKEELGNRAGAAMTLGNIGTIHRHLGSYAKARGYQERALKLKEELGDRAGVAMTLENIGINHYGRGAHAKALRYYERALELKEELGNRAVVAATLVNIGLIHESLGDYAKALGYYERARALAAELGALDTEVEALNKLAKCHLLLEKPAEALRAARSGVAKLPLLVGGLAEEQGATARDQWTGLLDVGVRAGMQLDDASEVSFFIESGRAGGLLESLGGRKVLQAVIPEELRREEIAARAAVLAAQARHGRALKAGKRPEIDAARTELDAARDKVLAAVAKIQRSAKAVADVAYPEAAPLVEIQAALAHDEVLVSYAILEDETVALVVTNKEARVVELGKTGEIEAALEAVMSGGGTGALTRGYTTPEKGLDPSAAFKVLRQKLVVALGLDAGTTRLLISPAGALSYLPFAVLAPEREVVYVPSGTTYTVLRDDRAKRGERVLALGDPDYTTKRASSVYGAGLERLPGTRAEAKAVGDVVLLGKDATETRLAEALSEAKRWRSVHLACHGLVNAAQPQLSALALVPDGADDGFLTVLEVFQAKIPADLVVLSACETAKGKLHQEGIIGFTRAFMLAGAPRVIVSLWKVDDDATRALMVKFYELWSPSAKATEDKKPLPTATALKQAQAFVRGHEKWKHPYYWAAWQLWGLGD